MLVTLETLAVLAGLLTFVCGAVNYAVIRPLNTAITELRQTVAQLSQQIADNVRNNAKQDERLTAIEHDLAALRQRMDTCRACSRVGGSDAP